MDNYKTRLEILKSIYSKTLNSNNAPMFSRDYLISTIFNNEEEKEKAKYDLIYIYEKRKRIAKKILQS